MEEKGPSDGENDQNEDQNEIEPLLSWHNQPSYMHFRVGRQPEPTIVLDCPIFDCNFYQRHNTTVYGIKVDGKDFSETVDVRETTFSLAALVSYLVMIGCFIAAKSKDSALAGPSALMMEDIPRKDAFLLFVAFVFITVTFLGASATISVMTTHGLVVNGWSVVFAAAVILSFWASINTCHVFAISSFACGSLAQNTIRRIQDVQNGTLDDIIKIHEDLCTVVFNTVSAYSVWFVVHWFTYGAGAVVAVIYISEESISRAKYHTHAMEFVFLGLLLVCVLYLFVFPCACAARITSNCAGIYEKINCTTSEDWPAQGHPFKDRRNISLFISYAKDRHCGFKVGRITFNTSLAWLSFFFGLTGLLYHFF
ncbi:uncharacterized protein LOC144643123 isoform X4 [Oculina patagonica]